MEGGHEAPLRWREKFGREISAILVLKLAALAVLWALFFSPAHRLAVGAQETNRRFGLPADTRTDSRAVGATHHTPPESP